MLFGYNWYGWDGPNEFDLHAPPAEYAECVADLDPAVVERYKAARVAFLIAAKELRTAIGTLTVNPLHLAGLTQADLEHRHGETWRSEREQDDAT